MKAGLNQYPPMAGIPQLREAIAGKVRALYGTSYDPEHEITVTPGATYGLFTAIATLIRPGDEVIVFEPAYDSYVPSIEVQGGKGGVCRAQVSRLSHRLGRGGTRDHAEDTHDHHQHAQQSDRQRVLGAGHAGARENHARYRHRDPERRGLRAHRVRRRAAPERGALSGARRTQLRRLLVRQDLSRHRLENGLLPGARRH